MLYGWTGKFLRIDLTRGIVTKEDVNADWARDYVGGRGLATRYLLEEMDPSVDPFSPDNKMILATGPLTGTNASCGARYAVMTKSPLTGGITSSNSGGHWGPELKFAGYDMVMLEGKAPKPSYIWIDDDKVEIRSAENIWGKTVPETEDLIRKETGVPDCKITCIGPAGENLVRFAAIINDKARAAGRSGVGAVMGSKNVKAIAVRGSKGVRVASPDAMFRTVWASKKKLKESAGRQEMTQTGTAAILNPINEANGFPVRNHQEVHMEHGENLSGETLSKTHLVANKACFACTIACGRVSALKENDSLKYMVNTHPRNWKIAGEGPEYEVLWGLGGDTAVDDLVAVIKANFLCNDLGLDPISMGSTLAAGMELYEKEHITQEQTGMPLSFGSGETLIRMVEATAYREGFGNELAEGSKRMTAKFGHPELHMGSHGQEFAAYDPRTFRGMSLAYATSNRGACHLQAFTPDAELFSSPKKMDPQAAEGKAELVKGLQDETSVIDATGLCRFVSAGMDLDDYRQAVVAATGINYTKEDFIKAGERIWNQERLFNIKAGQTSKDDSVPPRIDEKSKLNEMLPEYYSLRGWTPEGEPTKEKLAELGII